MAFAFLPHGNGQTINRQLHIRQLILLLPLIESANLGIFQLTFYRDKVSPFCFITYVTQNALWIEFDFWMKFASKVLCCCKSSFIFKVCGRSLNKVWSPPPLSPNKTTKQDFWQFDHSCFSSNKAADSSAEYKNFRERPTTSSFFNQIIFQSFTTLVSDKRSKCVHQVKQFNSRKAGMGGGFNPEPVVPKILRSFRSVQRKIRPSHCQEILGNLLQNFNKTGGGKMSML